MLNISYWTNELNKQIYKGGIRGSSDGNYTVKCVHYHLKKIALIYFLTLHTHFKYVLANFVTYYSGIYACINKELIVWHAQIRWLLLFIYAKYVLNIFFSFKMNSWKYALYYFVSRIVYIEMQIYSVILNKDTW